MSNRLFFIAPLSAFRKRTRLAKMVGVLCDRGSVATLFGWERVKGERLALKWSDSRIEEVSILKGGGYATKVARAMYPVWMFVVFWSVIRLKPGSKVFCLGWETAFPAVIASYISRVVVIFDDADRFSLLIRLPSPVRRLVQRLEYWTSIVSALHLVPSRARYDWWHDDMRVLSNTPSTSDFNAAANFAISRENVDLVLYVNGWISWDTGASSYLRALEILESRGVKVIMHVAGRVVADQGLALLRHPSVRFHGELPQAQALGIYAGVDVVLTFYDPEVEINAYAESNKWGDCVYFGVPFIVNAEVSTARHFVKSGAAWDVKYKDSLALADLLEWLSNHPQRLIEARAALESMRPNYKPYEQTFGNILDEVLNYRKVS